ncbi:MAG TPA: sugar ABC transporter permease [Acidilobales archaeon]|nr:MAG: sugar ABC transporter permease [Thermoprotei archaeon]HDD26384.1 sugar ABC transporter permease [Acidilobales archaeon]
MSKPNKLILERYVPYILIAPALAYLLFFIGYPLAQAIVLAFIKEGGFTLENINYLLYSPSSKFFEALYFTLLLALVVIPIQVAIALGLATLLNIKFRGRNAALYIIILPLTISDVAAGLIWYTLLSPNGFFNKLLMNLGVISEPIYFFGYQYRHMEFLAIVLTEIWRATAIVFVILFAGLQLVSGELIEAAEVFGANAWQRLKYIIFPLLKPSLQAALIIRTLFAFQVFGVVWTLAGRDIPVLAGEAYYEQVELRHTGVAAIYALVIAAMSVALGYLYIKMFRAKYLEAGT